MSQLVSPTELINRLVADSQGLERVAVLNLARKAVERQVQRLADERLQAEESGWVDHWQAQHTRATDTLAVIQQALATC